MNDKELLQQALDVLETLIVYSWNGGKQGEPDKPEDYAGVKIVEAIKARLAQPDYVCGELDSEGVHRKDNPCFMINGLTKEQTNETMSVKGLINHE